jgi:hypothetical protein
VGDPRDRPRRVAEGSHGSIDQSSQEARSRCRASRSRSTRRRTAKSQGTGRATSGSTDGL